MSEGYFSKQLNEWFESPEARDHYERQATLMQAAQEPDPFENYTADQIAQLVQRAYMNEEQQQQYVLGLAAANRFMEETPEYVAGAYNGQLMKRELERLGLDQSRPDHIAQAWQSLRQDGLGQINEQAAQELEQEVRQETRRRRVGSLSTKRNWTPPPAPIDPESLSDEDLEIMTRRAVGEWFK